MEPKKIQIGKNDYAFVETPVECCHCEKGIDPLVIKAFAYTRLHTHEFAVAFQCPVCDGVFIGLYERAGFGMTPYPYKILGGHIMKKVFEQPIIEISPNFVTSYNEAYAAEQSGATGLAGIGYRRAFEFLMKDYAIYKNPENAESIKNSTLAKCISDYSPTDNTKELWEKTAWIGNDFSHYNSKHPDISLEDLKSLIDFSVSDIVNDIKRKQLLGKIGKK